MRRLLLAAGVALLCSACALDWHGWRPFASGPSRLDEAAVRAFAVGEAASWTAHDFDGYYARFAPDAVFVSVRWNGDGTITRQSRTLQQHRADAEQFFRAHPGTFVETDTIDRIDIAPDGMSARILGSETARISEAGKQNVLRATTEETVMLRSGRILSSGQTDTAVR